MKYQEQIKHPKWQQKRLEILNRDGFKCCECGANEKELHVHHLIYIKGNLIWEYDNKCLISLCSEHHKLWHKSKDLLFSYINNQLLNGLHPLVVLSNITSEF